MITEKHIYLFKAKSKHSFCVTPACNAELRRRVAISKLAGLTVSKDPQSSELVIHVINEADIRIKSNK